MSKEELITLFVHNGLELQNSLIGILGQLVALVISALLMYYLTIQAFTYDRRFVNTVLKSTLYIDEQDEPILGFGKKFRYSIDNFVSGM